MKRLLLLPVLIFGLSFACDQPYEEVAGYKIGYKYKEEGLEKIINREDGNIVFYYGEKNAGPFKDINITTLNGDIAIINMYIDPSNYLDDKIVSDLSKSLEERWGEFTVGEYGVYENYKPKSKALGNVSIYKPNKAIGEKAFSVTYTTKKYLEYKKEQEVAEEAKKQEEIAQEEARRRVEAAQEDELRRKKYSDF